MGIFKKDPDLGAKAYAAARTIRAGMARTQPTATRAERTAVNGAVSRLRNDSARNN